MTQPDLGAVRLAVRDQLRPALDEFFGTTAIREASCYWENRKYTPPELYDPLTKLPNLWVKETLFVIAEQPYALQLHEVRGRTLFEILSPVGSGTERPEALRKLIVDAFEKKYGLSSQPGTAVHLDRVSRDSSRNWDELWWATPVSVYWRTYSVATVNRTT